MTRKLSFSNHAFLVFLFPICLTPLATYFVITGAVKGKVKGELRDSLNRTGILLNSTGPEYNRHYSQLLAVLGEPATLRTLLQFRRQTSSYPEDRSRIRKDIEGELRELSGALDYDFLGIADTSDRPIAGCFRKDEGIVCPEAAFASRTPYCFNCHTTPATNVMEIEETLYNVAYVPLREGQEILGSLTVGSRIGVRSLQNFMHTAVVTENNKILLTTFPPQQVEEIERQFQTACGDNGLDGCEIEVRAKSYLALQPEGVSLPGNSILFTFQSIDAGVSDFMHGFAQISLLTGGGSILMLLLFSAVGTSFFSKPLTDLIAHLSKSERSGKLESDFSIHSPIKEVNQLAEAFNRASKAIQESQGRLEETNLQFIEAMARALEARAPNTAGHSDRVSVTSTAIAEKMRLPPDQVEIIRISAKLHDIGKIGISDAVLRKSGKLTPEEFAQIQLHPQIGKRILEKVERFHDYLPIVELHHENFDGSGYPYGLKGEEIPLGVRIVHVADVYDAITSHRAYREAMPEEQALEFLVEGNGTLFDPAVLDAFLKILAQRKVLQGVLEGACFIKANT